MCAGAAADQAGLAEAGHHPLEAGAQHLGGLLGGARGGQAGGQDVGGPGPGASIVIDGVQNTILFAGVASEQPSPAVLGPRAGSPPPWHLQPRARDPVPGPLR